MVSGAFVVRPCADAGLSISSSLAVQRVAGSPEPENIVAFGDISQDGLVQKTDFVLGEMLSRLTAVRAAPDDPNVINVYTVHEVSGLPETIEGQLAGGEQMRLCALARRPACDRT